MAHTRKTWSFRTGETTLLEVSAASDPTRAQIRRRGRWSLVVGMFVAMLAVGAVVASADQITNNLDTTADAVAEVMPLTVGGANGTTRLYVVTQNGDGKQGCNLTGGTTATISLSSSNTSVATVSPSSVTFTSCVDSTTGPVVTVTPVAEGTATIGATLTGNTTGGSFNVAPVTFTVNVSPPPNTPSHVSVTGVAGGDSYEIGSVPAAGCSVTDAEDGNSSFAATLSAVTGPLASYGLGSQTTSCSYTDAGGLTASASVTYNIVDTGAPASSASATSNGSPYTFGDWANHDVVVILSGSDSGSGLNAIYYTTDGTTPTTSSATYASPFTISAEGTTSVQWFAVDNAGNSESVHGATAKIDKAAPQQSSCDAPDGNWHSANVTLTCVYTDSVSGPATQQVALSTNIAPGVETANASASASGAQACDTAGNCAASPADISGNKIDRKAPTITDGGPTTTPNGNGWYNTDVVNTFLASDAGSGLANTCSASWPKTTSGEGTAVKVSAGACVDAVGNSNAGIDSAAFQIDETKPTVSVTGFTDGQKFVKGVGALPTVGCGRSDVLSGIDTFGSTGPTVTAGGLNANGVGSVTYTCGARDNAGNTDSASATYTVVYGQSAVQFLQPINGTAHDVSDNPDVSTFKAGSTVPVKVQVKLQDGTVVRPVFAQWLAPQKGSATSQPVDEGVYTAPATSGSNYTWDPGASDYQYNWGTAKNGAGYYWLIGVRLDDGQDYTVYVSLR